MDFKKTLLVILTFITCMFALMLASSYAWYSYTNGSTTFDVVTNNEDINVTYTTGMYIDTQTALPIAKEEIDDYSEKNKFSIDLNSEDLIGKILVDISLVNIAIDDSLKNENFKYDLLYNGTSVNTGNFATLEENTIQLGTNISLDTISNNDFELRLYILDDGTDQNNLMNKTFQGTIAVNAISRLKAKIEQTGVDILVDNITIDGKKSKSLPNTGIYNMTYNCKKNSILTWDPISKTITYESGSKVKDICSLTFTTNNNYEYKLLNEMKIGSYVKYKGSGGTVGNTSVSCQNKANNTETIDDNPAESPNSCLGENAREELETEKGLYGYCTNSSEKYHESGWRIAYIKDEKVALISAGAPECITIENKAQLLNITNTKALKYCNTEFVDNNCTCQDDNNDKLCDNTNSLDAWSINNEDFKKITMSINNQERSLIGNNLSCFNKLSDSDCGYNNSILDNGGTYLFSETTSDIIVWQKRHITANNQNNTYGLRPIISLSKDIKVTGGTGTIDDPYIISK
ncbi:MAG: hypothetical protein VZS44_04490 [Bacilli bacterium]|nr:hypothetical protein [Bacilli bacterium]